MPILDSQAWLTVFQYVAIVGISCIVILFTLSLLWEGLLWFLNWGHEHPISAHLLGFGSVVLVFAYLPELESFILPLIRQGLQS